jgi:prevent-host-death family protein
VKLLELSQAKQSLGDYAAALGEDGVIVTKRGKAVAALMPIRGVDLETLTVSTSPEFLQLIEESRARWRSEGGISTEEARRQLGLPKPRPQKRKTKQPKE